MDALEAKLGPEQRAFIQEMEGEAHAQFARRAQEEGDDFFRHISTSIPEDIGVFQNLQDTFRDPGFDFGGFGPDFGPGGPGGGFDLPPAFFDRAINVQTDGLRDHLRDIDSADASDHFLSRFDDAPDFIVDEIKRRHGDFDDLFVEKQRFIEEERFRKMEFDVNLMTVLKLLIQMNSVTHLNKNAAIVKVNLTKPQLVIGVKCSNCALNLIRFATSNAKKKKLAGLKLN